MVAIDKSRNPALVSCRADLGEIESYNDMEIPVRGSASARTLVSITGVAVISLDTNETWPEESDDEAQAVHPLDILLYTKYQVPQGEWVDAATTASLASIQADDSTNVLYAIEEIETEQGTGGLVQVHLRITVAGDIALYRISFQSNILTTKVKGVS